MNLIHSRNPLIALAAMVVWQGIAPVNAQMPANGGAAGAFGGLQAALGTLPLISDARTRSISAENPTGEKGKGGMAVPNPADPNLPRASDRATRSVSQAAKPRRTTEARQTGNGEH